MKKLGLVIGINYVGSGKELRGCINDAKGLTKLLIEEFDFSINNIQILIEDLATKNNILKAIENMISNLQSGDVGVLTFAGHGSRTADLEPFDEDDRMDEVIIPYDGISKYENYIKDDDIDMLLLKIPPDVHFTVIFDSCHSATATRDNEIRYIPPSIGSQELEKLVQLYSSSSLHRTRDRNMSINHYYLAACKSNQEAGDGEQNGYFTGALLKTIKKGMSYQQIKESVEPIVHELRPNQDPQFEGPDLSKPIFGL